MRILKETYFVTIEFGPEGFSAWKGVWLGLLEVMVAAGESLEEGAVGDGEVEKLMRELEPEARGEYFYFVRPGLR